jgi:hypothetical protein
MKFERRRGVSVIIATLLMIAISVTAGILVNVIINGFAGNLTQNGGGSVNEKLAIQAYTFAFTPAGCTCAQWLVEIFLLNPGPSSTTINAVYFDGALQTLTNPTTTNTALASGVAYTALSSVTIKDFATTCSSGASPANTICFTAGGGGSAKTTYAVGDTGQVVITFGAAQTYGSGHTVKVVSSTGATNVFTVIAGIRG